MTDALGGLRVLDLSWGPAGALGVLLLAEHGADVIKVEPPGGDPLRGYDGHAVWNRSRRSVTVNLQDPTGLEAFRRLAATADVVVETFRPGVADRLGIGYDTLAAVNPRLVYCSCPGWPEGHRRDGRPGWDALVQAASGQQWEQPGWRPGPVFLAVPLPSAAAMWLVAAGTLAALVARERTGRGQHVRTSLFQGVLAYTTQIWSWVPDGGFGYHAVMAKTHPPGIHQEMVFEVAGGAWVHTSMMSGLPPKRSMDEVVGVGAEPTDAARFGMLSEAERAEFTARRREAYRRWERDALVTALREHNHAVEPITSAAESLGCGGRPHPQLTANGMVVEVDDPALGRTTQVGVPVHLLGTPGRVRAPRPAAGAHNAEVFGELGYTAEQIAAFTAAPGDPAVATGTVPGAEAPTGSEVDR